MEENEAAEKLVLFAKLLKNCQQHYLALAGRSGVCVNFDFDAFGVTVACNIHKFSAQEVWHKNDVEYSTQYNNFLLANKFL